MTDKMVIETETSMIHDAIAKAIPEAKPFVKVRQLEMDVAGYGNKGDAYYQVEVAGHSSGVPLTVTVWPRSMRFEGFEEALRAGVETARAEWQAGPPQEVIDGYGGLSEAG